MYYIKKYDLNDKNILNKLILEYGESIINIINHCFNESLDVSDLLSIFHNTICFLVFEKETVVGIANIKSDYISVFNKEQESYKYINYENDIKENILKENKIFPSINTLCRKENYKGVGTYLLDYLSDYYKKTSNYIYLVSESIKGKHEKNNHEYLKNNKQLHEYYKKNGFEIMANTYFIEIDDDNEYILYNVFQKLLNT
jgi:hypothetical protein